MSRKLVQSSFKVAFGVTVGKTRITFTHVCTFYDANIGFPLADQPPSLLQEDAAIGLGETYVAMFFDVTQSIGVLRFFFRIEFTSCFFHLRSSYACV